MALKVLQPMPPAADDLAAKPSNHDIGENKMQCNRESCEVITDRIYVGNLGFDIDDRDLYYFFYQFGPVHHTRVIAYRGGYSKGYGFVTFNGSEIAKNLLEWPEKDNIWLKGRKLRIGAARQSYWSKGRSWNRQPRSQKEYEEGCSSDNIKTNDFIKVESQEVPVKSSVFGESASNYLITNQAGYSGTCSTTPPYPVFFYPTYTQLGSAATNMASYPFSCQDMSGEPYPGYEATIYEDSSYSMYQYHCSDLIFTEQEQLAYLPYNQGNYMCMGAYNDPQPIHLAQLDNNGEFLPHNEIYQGNQYSELPTSETYFHYYQADQEATVDHGDLNKPLLLSTDGPQLGDSGFQESSWNEKSLDHGVDCDNTALQGTSLFKQADHNSCPEAEFIVVKTSVEESYFGIKCSDTFPFASQNRSSDEEVSDLVHKEKNSEGECESETNQCYNVEMNQSMNEPADNSKSGLKNKHVGELVE